MFWIRDILRRSEVAFIPHPSSLLFVSSVDHETNIYISSLELLNSSSPNYQGQSLGV
jgi:hypothetical protein